MSQSKVWESKSAKGVTHYSEGSIRRVIQAEVNAAAPGWRWMQLEEKTALAGTLQKIAREVMHGKFPIAERG